MMKKILTLGLCTFFSFASMAMENNQTFNFHSPEMAKDIRKIVRDRVEADKTSVLKEGLQGGVYGAVGPTVFSFMCGSEALENPDATPDESKTRYMVGGLLSSIIFSVITVPLGIVTGPGGFVVGCINGITKEMGAKMYDRKFDAAITQHILQWISLVKNGRLAIRSELQKYMKDHNENSLKSAIISFFKDEKFKQYFGDKNWQEDKLDAIVLQVSREDDSWEKFFGALTEKIKNKNISSENWKKVEKYLVAHKQEYKEFELMDEKEINEYLPFAIYFFSIMDKRGPDIIKSYIDSI